MKRRKLPPSPGAPVPNVAPAEASPEDVVKAAEVAQVNPGTVADLVEDDALIAKAKRMKGKDGRSISRAIAFLLDLSPEEFMRASVNVQTKAEEIALQIVLKASSGVQEAIKVCLERTEGRVPQALEVTNNAVREVHERVNDIAVTRANEAALAITGAEVAGHEANLDVPQDGDGGSEED